MLFMYSPAGMEVMFPKSVNPEAAVSSVRRFNPADLAAMASVAQKYRFSLITP